MNAAIGPSHLERKAYVYIRQSSRAQVLANTESTLRQYDLAERAKSLGWTESAIEVIDEDLAKSGATSDGRTGLKKMAQAVAEGRVGAILALEVSRWARDSIDWQHLLKLCAVAEVVVLDEQSVYDPRIPDHKALLNLKGTMSELELYWLRLRLNGARQSKARRGELAIPSPTGYVWGERGFELEPDEAVRQAIHVVLDRFEIEPSANAVVQWAWRTGFLIPTVERRAGGRTELYWRPLRTSRLCAILHNPTYAGVYAYGRQPTEEVIRDGEVVKVRKGWVDPDEWLVRIMDAHPGYITWERYVKNQKKLRENSSRRSPTGGAPREGKALLSGLLICGRCGMRMKPQYASGSRRERYSYECVGEVGIGGPKCWSVTGPSIDAAVEDLFLKTAVPEELELTIAVEKEVHRQAEELAKQWKLRIERAEYEARVAERRYKAVDPDNRVVARTLEHDWEMKLREVQGVQQRYEEARRERRVDLTEADRVRIRALAADLPKVWRSPTTGMADRKAMLRLAIEAVALAPIEGSGRETSVKVQWKGGGVSEIRVVRPRHPTANPEEAVELIRQWASEKVRDEDIAERLNDAGIPTGLGRKWNKHGVRMVRWQKGIERTAPHAPRRLRLPDRHPDGRYSLRGAAERFGVSYQAVRHWIKTGLVEASQEDYEDHRGVWWLEIDEEAERRISERPRRGDSPKLRPLPDQHPDGRYSIAGTARHFGVSTTTVWKWLRRGLIRGQQEEYENYGKKNIWWLEIDQETVARLAPLARDVEERNRRRRNSPKTNL